MFTLAPPTHTSKIRRGDQAIEFQAVDRTLESVGWLVENEAEQMLEEGLLSVAAGQLYYFAEVNDALERIGDHLDKESKERGLVGTPERLPWYEQQQKRTIHDLNSGVQLPLKLYRALTALFDDYDEGAIDDALYEATH